MHKNTLQHFQREASAPSCPYMRAPMDDESSRSTGTTCNTGLRVGCTIKTCAETEITPISTSPCWHHFQTALSRSTALIPNHPRRTFGPSPPVPAQSLFHPTRFLKIAYLLKKNSNMKRSWCSNLRNHIVIKHAPKVCVRKKWFLHSFVGAAAP